MRQKIVLSTALTLALASAGSAFAQGNSRHERGSNDCPNGNCAGPDQRQRPSPNARQPSRPDFQDRNDHDRNPPQRHAQPGYEPQPRMNNDMQQNRRGAGPYRSYYRGDRLPLQYRSRQYVVNDWRGHHLNAPPRGYHWVQNGGDYLLVAITTGVILQLLLSN
jgi:Ni/Co efflux regulator RcnB